jgi:hypothetical protein
LGTASATLHSRPRPLLCSPSSNRLRGPARACSPPKTRNARTTAKPRTPSHKRGARDAGARLHRVLGAKISKPSRSTKPLTLPEDMELATTKRAARGAKAGDQVGAAARASQPVTWAADARRAGRARDRRTPAETGGRQGRPLPNSRRVCDAVDAASVCPCALRFAQAPAASPYKSLAEKVHDFQSKTPQRFRAQPKGAAGQRTGSAGASRGGARQQAQQQQQQHQPQITEAKVRGSVCECVCVRMCVSWTTLLVHLLIWKGEGLFAERWSTANPQGRAMGHAWSCALLGPGRLLREASLSLTRACIHAVLRTSVQTPVLWTSTRARPRRFKTREEEEEEAMQHEREAGFHARPVE